MVKRKFFTWLGDPFVTSCVSDAQNCGKMQILDLAEQPFRHFGRVGRSKLWYNANSASAGGNPLVTSCVLDAQNCGKMGILDVAPATLSSLRMCRTVLFLWWCFSGGVFVVVFLWCCGGVVVFLWWCFCGGVFLVVFLWWCFGVFVVLLLLLLCFCGVVVVFLRLCF